MKIHQCAHRGDIAALQQELEKGISIEAVANTPCSVEPLTPLQFALSSPIAGGDMVSFLIAHGAVLNLAPQQGNSDLFWAIRSGKIEKVELLLNSGADLGYVDEDGYDALINAMFTLVDGAERHALVQYLIKQGAKLNGKSHHGESALSISSHKGWFDIIQVLLDAGSAPEELRWTDLMEAIALGSLQDMEARLAQGADLTAVDCWKRLK